MKKHLGKIAILIIVAVIGIILSQVTFESVDVLMRPPKNEGENSEIQKAFEAAVGDKYSLRSPLSGEYKSSFILIDLNGDGDDEVVVFYCASSSADVVRMNILDTVDGSWLSISDIESSHSDIHQVDFADVNNDGNKEIILGCSIFETELTNTLNVYKITDTNNQKNTENIFTKNYTDFIVCDVNGDKKTDLLVFDKSAVDNLSGIKATYYDFQSKRVYSVGEFFVDPVISSINSVKFDIDASTGTSRFYIDGFKTDSSITTDVFMWDNFEKSFTRHSNPEEPSVTTDATRTINIGCRDVNSDGIIEIPFEEVIDGSEVVSVERAIQKKQSIIKWMQFKENELVPVSYELINSSKGYSLEIKNQWYGNFTVKNNLTNGLLTFYSVQEGEFDQPEPKEKKPKKKKEEEENNFAVQETQPTLSDKTDDMLFSIFATPESDNNLYELSGYRFIKSDNGYNYYCQIYNKGRQMGITKENIKNILIT